MKSIWYMLLLLSLLLPNHLLAEDYYWVGGTGDWSDFQNHWAKTSGGTDFHSSIPGQEDRAIFDLGSTKEVDDTVWVDISPEIKDLWINEDALPFTFVEKEPEREFIIYGALRLLGQSRLAVSGFRFRSEEEVTIRTADHWLGDWVFFEGSGTFNVSLELRAMHIFFHQGSISTIGIEGFSVIVAPKSGILKLRIEDSKVKTNNWVVSDQFGGILDMDATKTHVAIGHYFQLADFAVNFPDWPFLGDGDLHFDGFGLFYGRTTFSCKVIISGENSYQSLWLNHGSQLFFPLEKQTVFGLYAKANSELPIEINDLQIEQNQGVQELSYLKLTNSTAAGVKQFEAHYSIDNGGNSGWNISPAPNQSEVNLKLLEGDSLLCSDAAFVTLTIPEDLGLNSTWYRNDTLISNGTSVYEATKAGIYYVDLSTTCQNNSTRSNSIEVRSGQIPTLVIEASGETEVCSSSPTPILLSIPEQPGFTYKWERDGIDLLLDQAEIEANASGSYRVSLVSGKCNAAPSEPVLISLANAAPERPLVQSSAQVICEGDSILIWSESSNVDFEWNFNNILLATTDSAIWVTQTGSYQLRVANSCGSSFGNQITIKPCAVLPNLTNTITPNNDGANDRWEIPDLQQFDRHHVKIFNRWGQVVFETSQFDGWDGDSNGNPLPVDTYYYEILINEDERITGWVSVLR